MNIGATIKQLRQNMTQEQLANKLGVTPQAVSRWETGVALPGITQIPALVHIFGVSADILLGISVEGEESEVDAVIDDAWFNYGLKGDYAKALVIIANALRKFPDNEKLLTQLMVNNWGLANGLTAELDDERQLLLHTVIQLGEKLLKQSTDDEVRNTVRQFLCYSYDSIGDKDKAIEIAETMPLEVASRENLLKAIQPQ